MIEERRSLGMYILLTLVTCGIYSFYFYYKFAQDMNTVCDGDGEHTAGLGYYILFSFLTCGIYAFYWYYKVGNRQAANGPRYGLHIQDDGKTILVWLLLGSLLAGIGAWIALYLMIKNLNMLAHAYNNSGNAHAQYNNTPNNNFNQYPPQNYNNSYRSISNDGMNYSNTMDSMNTAPLNLNTSFQTQTEQSSAGLYCKTGEFAGSTFPINMNENIIIGREMSCNIKFDANTPNVSRRHCTVYFDGQVWITDNGSSFGTYLDNGKRLTPNERVPLSKGEGFYLGNKNISFTIM